MTRSHRNLRILGIAALAIGLALAAGAFAVANLRVALTNYASSISVDRPLVYYVHDLRAGDTVYFLLRIEGGPVDLEILRGTSATEGSGGYAGGVEGDLVFRAPGLLGPEELRFSAPETATYGVAFASACEPACPTSLRAQVQLTMGSVGLLSVHQAIVLGGILAAVGGAATAFARRRPGERVMPAE